MAAKDIPNRLPHGMDMLDVPKGTDRNQLAEVIKMKEQANAKFREGDFFSAKCLYSGALELLERCCLHLPQADETWEGIKNNMAFCDLKRQEWTRVVDTTNEILARNPKNMKALYRRGVARLGQNKLQDAQKDLQAVVEAEPENGDARQKLAEVVREIKSQRSAEREQAGKMRGFLQGERLDDTVAICEDGCVRKLHSNEHAPLFAPWIKRAWLSPGSGSAAVVTAHIVLKTPSGKEIFSTRKPQTTMNPQPAGPQMVNQSKPAERPAMPARWVMDDVFSSVFRAWNVAVKTLQVQELGRFEVAKHSLGPSVEDAIKACLDKWLADTPARREALKDMPPELRTETLRRQAVQILGLPHEFCMDPIKDPLATLNMEMELLEVSEFQDLDGDGKRLLRVLREGPARAAQVRELCTVAVHFRIAKLLMNFAIKDTRMGLASTSEGLVLREDRTKEAVEFVVGEEAAAKEGEFVPPCIGECLLIPPGGVVEGMAFELILQDGVPIRDMDKTIYNVYADGKLESMPDTSGPVSVRIEVERVIPPMSGPSSSSWQGLESIKAERARAEHLEAVEDGRHKVKAVKRWRRILVWLEGFLRGHKAKLQADSETAPGGAGETLYDLDWAEGEDSQDSTAPAEPTMFEVDSELLKLLKPEELVEWARAHAALAKLLGTSATDVEIAQRHGRCSVQATSIGAIPKEVEIAGRSALAARLLEQNATGEALEVIKAAQALDPTSDALKDQAAHTTQRHNDHTKVDTKEVLKLKKQELNDSLDANDIIGLEALLKEVDNLPLTWEVVSETAIGKEVGKCAKRAEPEVAELAKAIISKLHRLAKTERPMWVR